MSAVTRTPTNRNFLSPLNFRLVLDRAPELNFYLQSASIPGLTFEGGINFTNPFPKIPIPGDHLSYSPLSVSFMVDEDLTNYLQLFNWMLYIAGPTSLDVEGDILPNSTLQTNNNSRIRSDIKLMVLTSSKNPNMVVTFTDAFPVALGELDFNTTATDVNYLSSSVTFEYVKYTIELL
jgi:hypothetical protein